MKEKLKKVFMIIGVLFSILIVIVIIGVALDSDDSTDTSNESMAINTEENSSKKWDDNYNAFREDVNFLSLNGLFKDIDSYEISQALRKSSTEELHSKMENYALLGNFKDAAYYAELCYHIEVDYLTKAKYQLYCYFFAISFMVSNYKEDYDDELKSKINAATFYFAEKANLLINKLNLPKSFYENDKVLKEFIRILDKMLE